MKTIDYYNQYADEFTQATLNVDMESLYKPFLAELPESARILDLGCGSGRDTLTFKNKGYQVDAIDYSEVLVERATQLTGIAVKQQSFYEIEAHDEYDGIWACASLLHCDRNRLPDVLKRIHSALRCGGICYMSFKYGTTDREKDGRAFTDLDEEQAKALLDQLNSVELLHQWSTVDKRPDRSENWLNVLWKKYG